MCRECWGWRRSGGFKGTKRSGFTARHGDESWSDTQYQRDGLDGAELVPVTLLWLTPCTSQSLQVTPDEKQSSLFKLVSFITGMKNSLKGGWGRGFGGDVQDAACLRRGMGQRAGW